ncbi:MAG: RluA family pseudouridine synthase [Eubacterium sp.]|jgi:23S rRNA pseudouridine1911/1915/1917 synthase|nr:RluA family pseudouridine synthase [Eubacterium sp.]
MCEKIKILYEDADILVCVKPAGTASETRKSGEQDMVSLLRNYRHGRGEEPYAGLVHRLDQPVEGILVFGKHARSTSALSRQLARGGFSKIYLAVTEKAMPQQEGRLVDFLKKDSRSNTSFVAAQGEAQAKKAELLYQVLETQARQERVQNLVRIELLTGRHHQIRVQMAHLGTPLAGDLKYGRQETASRGTQAAGPALCACGLEFLHPASRKKMKFHICPSQPVFQKFDYICGMRGI